MIEQTWRSIRSDVNREPSIERDGFGVIYFEARPAHKLDREWLKGGSSGKSTQASFERVDLHKRYKISPLAC